jgi:hypothetical protein
MSTLSLRLPNTLHDRLREVAEREGISINQLVTLAAAEKVATILTVDYLEERAKRADLRAFDRLLSRVPATPVLAGDELPARTGRGARVAGVREPKARHRATRKRKKS